jgi:4-carboxymuconolactone decarboxylase
LPLHGHGCADCRHCGIAAKQTLTAYNVGDLQLALCITLAALGLTDFLKIHAGCSLHHGATEEEVREIANIVIIVGGFPCTNMASQVISKLVADRDG